jgi:hypothetical protein
MDAMNFEGISAGNDKRSFTPAEKTVVTGHYVYVLQDPRDGKVFYAGQGVNDEVFVHFKQAEIFLKGKRKPTRKILRIIDIWCQDEDVTWYFIAHGLDAETANRIEAAVIDAFTYSQNGTLLNEINGIHSTLLLPEDIGRKAAPPVSVTAPCIVFIFPIHNALREGKEVYEAVRSAWRVNEHNRSLDAYAVGLEQGIASGAYKIGAWRRTGERFEFDQDENAPLAAELKKKDWRYVVSPAMGYYQRGNYLIAQFDGKGSCRLLRGAGPNAEWAPAAHPRKE